jgi:hypothetical protein
MSAVLQKLRIWPAALVAAIMAVAVLGFVSVGSATPSARAVPAPPAAPTRASQIQNLDQVKTAIKAYYGDTATSTPDPVDGKTMLHVASPTGAYAEEMSGIEARAGRYLAARSHPGRSHGRQQNKAIVLDVDDTTLNTYDYEIYSNFVYNPDTNADFVNAAAFPAVFGMPSLVNRARHEGYSIFFLTGRPDAQRAGTVTNLDNVGYPSVPADHLFLKDLSDPWLSSCAPSCSTIQYKSLTRRHIESLGYRIVANFGDQFSDLKGGFADKRVKIPNPMYFLP